LEGKTILVEREDLGRKRFEGRLLTDHDARKRAIKGDSKPVCHLGNGRKEGVSELLTKRKGETRKSIEILRRTSRAASKRDPNTRECHSKTVEDPTKTTQEGERPQKGTSVKLSERE